MRQAQVGGCRPWRGWLAVGLAALWLGLAVAGCGSDDSNLTGTDLVDSHIDGVLDTLLAADVIHYTGKSILDDEVPMTRQELLYLGSQGGTASAILANFDFSDSSLLAFTDSIGTEAFTLDNVATVRLKMLMPTFYRLADDESDSTAGLNKIYEVFPLTAPFDSTGTFPGPVPEYDITDLNIDPMLDESGEPQISLPPVFLVNWVQSGGLQGLMIQDGAGSDPGLAGYASRDNRHMGSQFPNIGVGSSQGPTLLVKLVDPDITVSIRPYADTSTFHTVAPAPADPTGGFMMRTGVRSYPVLRFDLSALPPDVYINRAVLYVVNDVDTSFGNLESIVVSEFDLDLIGTPEEALPLTELDAAVYPIVIMNSLDPLVSETMQFNVTSAIQRIANNVYEGDRGLIMTGGESIFPAADNSTSVDPDFYYTQFNFFGTAADDSLRPQLRITYSRVDEIIGGGDQ